MGTGEFYLATIFREAKLNPWCYGFLLLPAQGLFTTPECFVDSPRSDCHAWGAHPLYHFYASLLGIRPAGLGGGLERVSGSLPYGGGTVRAEYVRDGDGVRIGVELPPGVTGLLRYGGRDQALPPGRQEFAFTPDAHPYLA